MSSLLLGGIGARRASLVGQKRVQRVSSRGSVSAAALEQKQLSDTTPKELQFEESTAPETKQLEVSRINVIPKSRWADGIPVVMGGHLMASGTISPISTSKGAGLGERNHLFYYPDGDVNVAVLQYAHAAAASEALAETLEEASAQAIKEKGSFTVALSGGSLFKALAPLAQRKSSIDFSKWWVVFVDERNVPHSSPDSNYKGAYDEFLKKVPIPASQILAIKENLPVEQAATNYEGRLLDLSTSVLPRTEDGLPVIDSVLLGVGPDGHVASLFPNRAETAVQTGWVLPVKNSPKPPPERITLTMPVLNAAKHTIFVALGTSKAEIVQRVLEVQTLPGALPAQLVRPTSGKLTWLLDVESAKDLSTNKWEEQKLFPRSSVKE